MYIYTHTQRETIFFLFFIKNEKQKGDFYFQLMFDIFELKGYLKRILGKTAMV